MRPYFITFACLCTALVYVTAVPVPGSNQELDVLQIPLTNGKELDVLTIGSRDQEQLIAERNKRTIGLLRELFPDITKQIDDIVNRIIAQVIRVAGPDVLRSVLGSNRNMTPRPNLAADFDDDDDDDEDENDVNKLDNSKSSTTLSNDSNTRVKIDLPTFPPETSQAEATNKVSSSSLATSSKPTSTTTPTTTTSTSSSTTTPSTTSSSTTTTTTTSTTANPILIITPKTSLPSTTTTTTTTESPILIITPTTTATTSSTTNPTTTTTTTKVPDITLNVPNSLTSSMVNSLTASLQNEINSNTDIRTRAVNESQLMAIVESLNRLLNSTNYFVATRDNLSSSSLPSQSTTATTATTTTSSTTSILATTPKITKLLPVSN